MNDLRLMAQNKLLELAKAHEFPVVVYDAETGMASLNGTASVASALVNEVRSRFVTDTNYGRALVKRRENWSFQLHLGFHQEVSLDSFEQLLMESPPLAISDGNEQVRLHLSACVSNHPPQQQSSTGTTALLVFTAEPRRI